MPQTLLGRLFTSRETQKKIQAHEDTVNELQNLFDKESAKGWDPVRPDADAMRTLHYHPAMDVHGEGQMMLDDWTADISMDSTDLQPARWYDALIPGFMGITPQTLLGDVRVGHLNKKLQVKRNWEQWKPARVKRNSFRQHYRGVMLVLAYVVLFVIPIGLEMNSVTSAACTFTHFTTPCRSTPSFLQTDCSLMATENTTCAQSYNMNWSLNVDGVLADTDCACTCWSNLRGCTMEPHSLAGFACAVTMVAVAKLLCCNARAFCSMFPRFDVSAINPDRRYIADTVPQDVLMLILGAFSALWLYKGFNVAIVFAVLVLVLFLLTPYTPCAFQVINVLTYLGELIWACWNFFNSIIATGLAFLFDYYSRFNEGTLEVVYVGTVPPSFAVRPANEELSIRMLTDGTCLLLSGEDVTTYGFAYFGSLHIMLFMVGAIFMSIAELLKLRPENDFVLKDWVDLQELLHINAVLESWKPLVKLKGMITGIQEITDQYTNASDCLSIPRIQLNGPWAQEGDEAKFLKACEKELNDCIEENFFNDTLNSFSDKVMEDVKGMIVSVDLETVSWPGVMTATAFALWLTTKYVTAVPCLMNVGDTCTAALSYVLGWAGFCRSGSFLIGMEASAVLFIFIVSSIAATNRLSAGRCEAIRMLKSFAAVCLILAFMVVLMSLSGMVGWLPPVDSVGLAAQALAKSFGVITCLMCVVYALQYLEYLECPFVSVNGLIFVLLLAYAWLHGTFSFSDNVLKKTKTPEPRAWSHTKGEALNTTFTLASEHVQEAVPVDIDWWCQFIRVVMYLFFLVSIIFRGLVVCLQKLVPDFDVVRIPPSELSKFQSRVVKPALSSVCDEIIVASTEVSGGFAQKMSKMLRKKGVWVSKTKFLWHGTTVRNAESIKKTGFKPSVKECVFGSAVYLTSNRLKAEAWARYRASCEQDSPALVEVGIVLKNWKEINLQEQDREVFHHVTNHGKHQSNSEVTSRLRSWRDEGYDMIFCPQTSYVSSSDVSGLLSPSALRQRGDEYAVANGKDCTFISYELI